MEDLGGLGGGESVNKPILADLEAAAYAITKVETARERRRSPAAPFTTSTLQQEASRRLGYTARRTMALAQQLYEGIEVGEGGSVGLITYMRTDSTNVSELAPAEARQFISNRYGDSFMPAESPKYRTKSRGAQEARRGDPPHSVMRNQLRLRNFCNATSSACTN